MQKAKAKLAKKNQKVGNNHFFLFFFFFAFFWSAFERTCYWLGAVALSHDKKSTFGAFHFIQVLCVRRHFHRRVPATSCMYRMAITYRYDGMHNAHATCIESYGAETLNKRVRALKCYYRARITSANILSISFDSHDLLSVALCINLLLRY